MRWERTVAKGLGAAIAVGGASAAFDADSTRRELILYYATQNNVQSEESFKEVVHDVEEILSPNYRINYYAGLFAVGAGAALIFGVKKEIDDMED